MDLDEFDYELPAAAIAQAPAATRDASRLLLIDRARAAFEDRLFVELPELLRPADCLVVNDSRVIPARVLARDARGRAVELLFVPGEEPGRWRALVRPGRRCRPSVELAVGGEPPARLRIVAIAEDGSRIVERLDGTIPDLLDTYGVPPLPPYIARHAAPAAEDRERYQTVYARPPGSVAAPTAGLHFTTAMLDRLRARGVGLNALTLHVGPATFRPITAKRIEDHVLGPERALMPVATADAVEAARRAGRRVIAVGTTVARALEAAVDGNGRVRPLDGPVSLYIMPGHQFRVIDALLTNFHLPRSSLLVLAAAFAGRELILKAYRHAVSAGYRFYSYGDACLIV